MMKKLVISFLLAALPLLTFAQDLAYPSYNHRVITNGSLDNWFVSAGADWSASYSDQEALVLDPVGKSLFNANRSVVTMNLALGKWFTPTLGLRFNVHGFNAVRMGEALPLGGYSATSEKFRQWTYELQPILNLHNLIVGYKPRVWNASIYAGMGVARNYEAKPSHGCLLGSVGLLNTFHVSRRVHVNLDICYSLAESIADNCSSGSGSTMAERHDRTVRFGLGVGINLGKANWQKGPDMGAVLDMHHMEIDALNLTIQELEAENARLRNDQGGVEAEFEIPEAPEVDN